MEMEKLQSINIQKQSASLNELSLLFQLLSRGGKDAGVTLNELINKLGIKNEKFGRIYVFELFKKLDKLISYLGLKIVYIPIRRRFILKFKDLMRTSKSSVLSEGAINTLLAIAHLYLDGEKEVTLQQIVVKLKQTEATVKRNTRELISMNLLEKNNNKYFLSSRALISLDLFTYEDKINNETELNGSSYNLNTEEGNNDVNNSDELYKHSNTSDLNNQ